MSKAAPPDEQQLLADFLCEIREKAGLTQGQLGKKMGFTKSWVYHRESLHTPLLFIHFVAWCEACDAEPEQAFKRFYRSLT